MPPAHLYTCCVNHCTPCLLVYCISTCYHITPCHVTTGSCDAHLSGRIVELAKTVRESICVYFRILRWWSSQSRRCLDRVIFAGDPSLPTRGGYMPISCQPTARSRHHHLGAPGTGGCLGVCQQTAAAANRIFDRGAKAAHAAPTRHYWLRVLTACAPSDWSWIVSSCSSFVSK